MEKIRVMKAIRGQLGEREAVNLDGINNWRTCSNCGAKLNSRQSEFCSRRCWAIIRNRRIKQRKTQKKN